MRRVKLGLVGAGVMGARHIEAIDTIDASELVCIADPAVVTQEICQARGIPLYPHAESMMEAEELDAVNEFYFDKNTRVLRVKPNSTAAVWPPTATMLVATKLQTLVKLEGTQKAPVTDISSPALAGETQRRHTWSAGVCPVAVRLACCHPRYGCRGR